jgi:type II secretory pathway component PulC
MKHPLWIINSTLFLLLICILFFVFFSRISIAEREDIEPALYSKLKKEKKLQVNIAQIYQADLFGTYATTQAQQEKSEEILFPPPPEPHDAEIPELPKPQFLEPLDITLRGIFMVNTDSAHNRAIIADNKTKKEASYKIGDKIIDAQLIRIFANKIIVLRSNGQQEVLYLREQDARLDAGYAMIDEWSSVAKPISSTVFMVDPFAFAKRVNDLGQFIEMLHIVTAYKNGQSIGMRIGAFDEKSVGTVLGLQAGDIITHIEEIPAITLEERLAIYQKVLTKTEGDSVTVEVQRNQQTITFEYLLKEFSPAEGQKETPKQHFVVQKIEEDEKVKILQKKYEFAPTLQEIRQKERANMRAKGQKPQS